jgi:hypothetical protein
MWGDRATAPFKIFASAVFRVRRGGDLRFIPDGVKDRAAWLQYALARGWPLFLLPGAGGALYGLPMPRP